MSQNMPVPAVRLLQTYLAGQNPESKKYYDGKIDGLRGPKTHLAVKNAIRENPRILEAMDRENWESWSDKRRSVAVYQHYSNLRAAADPKLTEAGKVDGFWGPQTDAAYLSQTGKLEQVFNKEAKGGAGKFKLNWSNPHGFPKDNTASLTSHYGTACGGGRHSTYATVSVPARWDMRLAWDASSKVRNITIHHKLGDSLGRILDKIDSTYSEKEKRDLGLDKFAGSRACRNVRGGNRPSTHAYSIALDWDSERNRLKWDHTRARLAQDDAQPFWQAWYDEGWQGLGPEEDYDWMHVQAAIIN